MEKRRKKEKEKGRGEGGGGGGEREGRRRRKGEGGGGGGEGEEGRKGREGLRGEKGLHIIYYLVQVGVIPVDSIVTAATALSQRSTVKPLDKVQSTVKAESKRRCGTDQITVL